MKKMFSYLKPHWVSVSIIIVLVTLSALGQLLLPDFMSRMIGEGITPIYEVYDADLDAFVSTDYCAVSLSQDPSQVVGQ